LILNSNNNFERNGYLKNLGVIFGGISTEHDVSVISGLNVVKNLDKHKYNVKQIYIDKTGNWYEHLGYVESENIEITTDKLKRGLRKIENIITYLNWLDIIFPVLHGKNGEDGAIQGLLELLNKKYVGCGILASSIGMDKVYAKIIFSKANISQAKSIYIKKIGESFILIDNEFNETILNLNEICRKICDNLKFPIFVKPSNSGSSVGINISHNEEELMNNIMIACEYDNKIIVEEAIKGRELECAVLESDEVIASGVGEIIPGDEFYSFYEKYKSIKTKTVTKADIPEEVVERIRKLAVKAFKAIDGKGLARVDFFWDEEKDIVYINEINTMPGFTEISMYTKLWEEEGISYSKLLEILIENV